jgi:hypothetical protein
MSISNVNKQAQETFKIALTGLKEVIRRRSSSSFFQIQTPEFDETASIEAAAAYIDSSIEQIIKAMEKQTQNKSPILQAKDVLRRCFRASFHFSRVAFTVLKSTSAVCTSPSTLD